MKGFARRGSALAVLATVAGVVGLFSGETQAGGPQYVVTDLGTLGGSDSAAYGVNNLGQVTGYADLTNDSARHAYLYSNGAMTDLGTLGGTVSYGYAISNAGHVTGYSVLSNENFQAFLASVGSIGDIGSLNNNTQASEGHGINNLDHITGYSYLSATSFDTHCFLYSGSLMDLGTLGGDSSTGYGINQTGQLCGESDTTGDAAEHAFLYSNAMLNDLQTLGGIDSTAYGMNNSGQVTGFSSNPVDGYPHAFVYSGGIMSDLGTLGGSFSYGESVNDSGQVTGHSTLPGDSVSHAFLFVANNLYDLNNIVPASTALTNIDEADFGNHINDWGQIAAEGNVPNSSLMHALLLTPRAMGTQFSGGLGDLFGGTYNSEANAVANGGAVIGGAGGGGSHAFYWTLQNQITDRHRDSASVAASVAGISPDGRYLVGMGANSGGSALSAFRYDLVASQNAFLAPVSGDPSSAAFGISADDSTTVGWSGSANASERAVLWSGTNSPTLLGVLSGGIRSLAQAVSGNGSAVAGYSQATQAGSNFEAFLWTAAGGMVGLGDLTGANNNLNSSAFGISQDGTTVVGQANSSQGLQAFQWTQSTGMMGLGFIAQANGPSSGLGVSSDGKVIVGSSGGQAFVWDAPHGMRNLQSVLLSEYGVDFSGWTLSTANAVSPDATEVVGQGTDFLGNTQAFAAQINSRTYRFVSGDNYQTFHTSHLGGHGASVNFLDGTAGGASGTFRTVTVSTSSATSTQLVSDVANVSGTSTDTYVIQMSYDVAAADSAFGSDQSLVLGSFNGTSWVNALDGNSGGTPMFIGPNYNQAPTLGSCGLDTTNHVVWAVVNHGGQFAVINHTPPSASFSTWQQAYFTAAQLNDPTISGATADPNNNGLANLLEYAFNLNPTAVTQGNRPFAFLDPVNPNDFDLVYTKFLGATDLTFTVEESTDLESWSTASPTNVVLSDNGVLQMIKAEVPIPGDGTKLFLRLRVSEQ